MLIIRKIGRNRGIWELPAFSEQVSCESKHTFKNKSIKQEKKGGGEFLKKKNNSTGTRTEIFIMQTINKEISIQQLGLNSSTWPMFSYIYKVNIF